MMDAARAAELITEIGPLVDEIDLIEETGAGEWAVFFYNDAVLVTLVPESNKFTFSAAVGAVGEADKLRLYEMLLGYNYVWEETDGVRAAVDPASGDVVLLYDTFAGDLDTTRLIELLRDLREKAALLAAVVASTDGGDSGEEPAANQPTSADPGAMRV